jgi:uncharacterized protein
VVWKSLFFLEQKAKPDQMGSTDTGFYKDFKKLVPLPDCNNHKFALIRGTKSAFLLSDQSYELLKDPVREGTETPALIAPEVNRLKTLGFWPENGIQHEISEKYISISLHLIHGCNLACTYCNVQQGTYGEPVSLMADSTAYAAIDYLARIRNGRFPRLIFYGGEPLLNWKVLTRAAKKMTSLFPERAIEIVTNGTLIDRECAQFLADYDVFTILSMDGPKEVHDRNRPMKTGESSYEKAREGLEHLKKAGGRFQIRATWAPGYACYDDVLVHLCGLAGNSRQVTLAIEFDKAGTGAIEEYNDILSDRFRQAEENRAELPNTIYQYLDQTLRANWAPVPRCEAGHAGFSITPQGDIYPCQVSVSRKKFKLGTVWDGINEQGKEKQKEFLESSFSMCERCWANTYCSGPCRYAKPLPDNWPYCKTVKLHIMEAFKFIARTPSRDLVRTYQQPEISEEQFKAFEQGCALRDILWKHNHHIKPLSLCPQKGISP